ncbi:MAG: hypothetical protein P4L49_06195 [Desulfosporosinus sp.]|nr:hypothetical protein [Desulfosporosinus sp.]
MPWKKYKSSKLRKPSRQEVIIIFGTVGLGVLAVVAMKLFR